MACQDIAGTAMPADFDWFEYREREYVSDVSRWRMHKPASSLPASMTAGCYCRSRILILRSSSVPGWSPWMPR